MAISQHNAANDNVDAALAMGVEAFEKLQAELEQLSTQVAETITYLYGEKPAPELALDFVGRVLSWSRKQIEASQKRHGIVLMKGKAQGRV